MLVLPREIVGGDCKNGFAFRQNLKWIGSSFEGAFVGQIIHAPVSTFSKPLIVDVEVGGWGWSGNADKIKAYAFRFSLDTSGQILSSEIGHSHGTS
jgi:hypothetical protein